MRHMTLGLDTRPCGRYDFKRKIFVYKKILLGQDIKSFFKSSDKKGIDGADCGV